MPILILCYAVIGFAQFFAVWDAMTYYVDWGVLDFLLAMFTTYIPLLGAFLGYLGATNVCGWEPWQALALFFWYVPVGIIIMIFASATGK